MSNQYLQKLRRARFSCDEEPYRKVIRTSTEEQGTLFQPLCWNSSRTRAAFIMEETPQDDISSVDDQDEGRCSPQLNSEHNMPSTISPAPPDELSEVGARVRLYSESQVYTVSRWQDGEDGASAEDGGAADGAPFRGRSQSAPAALWKAKKYGKQLRRMSDEFDTWLDKGEMRRAGSPGKHTNRGWFSFLWGSKEEEGRE
ncbi:hypothetical protein NFI96_023171 [Prochilodus magdalenae]|nr:hypothetical protein NFI96_023171 [Prochilodus magdalenae]